MRTAISFCTETLDKRIVEATYSSQNFEQEAVSSGSEVSQCDDLDSGEKLACRWGNAVASMAQEDDSLKQIHLNKVGSILH
jgi:hypothetical protein